MPTCFLYLGLMLGIVVIWFVLCRRPIYEALMIAFVALLAVTNSWTSAWGYIQKGLQTNLLYYMVAFVGMSYLLTGTGVIDGVISLILALFGRLRGGAGYVAVAASSFMGALSGSGSGNVMTTGSVTIPAMKRSGFPPELAATIESAASSMGNMIPPSANIVAALGAFAALYPAQELTLGRFWIACWGCSAWFILQRLVMVFIFCRHYRVQPLPRQAVPSVRETLRNGWKGLFLPVIILLPFVLDYFFKSSFFTSRLGETGAADLSGSLLYFTAGIAAIYALAVAKDRSVCRPKALVKLFSDNLRGICPAIGACAFGYMIGALFADQNISEELQVFVNGLHMGRWGLAISVPLLTCLMGMIIPGSSVVVLFGPVFIGMFAAAGVEPILAAAMLPCLCGTMCEITPPLAPSVYAGMLLAEADFAKTVKLDAWWVLAHYVLEFVVLMGWLPVFGL